MPILLTNVSKHYAVIILFLIALLNNPLTSQADAAGGSIEYEWVSDSTYLVYFKLFTECTGISEPNTVSLCFYNSCTNQTFTKTLNKWSGTIPPFNSANGKEVPELCANTVTKCQSPTATIQGYREWWYSTTITLPLNCNSWRISTVLSSRLSSGNIVNSHMYVATTFNSTVSWQNSSPTFSSSAIQYNCQNQPSYYYSNASDPDGDSISWKIINPKTANTCSVTPSNVNFKTQTPSINTNNNPLQSNNTFSTSNALPLFAFTPTTATSEFLTIEISEYRNGVLIGTVIRDVLMIHVPCGTPTSPKPILDMASIQGASWGSNKLIGCVGKQIQACVDIRSSNSSAKYIVSSNINYIIPGVAVNYSNQSTSSVRACFNWTPTLSDTGTRTLYFFVKDSSCTHPLGLMFTKLVTLTIEVPSPVIASNDTTICTGTTIQLNATGGTNSYTWSILPGGTTNSLSCTICQNPKATPTAATTYTVQAAPNVCVNNPYYNDTVNVSIHTAATTNPGIHISAMPGTTFPKNTNVTFTATDSNCNNTSYQWIKNGSPVNGATNATWTTTFLNDQDLISCELTCNDTCPQPRISFSNDIRVTITGGISSNRFDDAIEIYPNPNNGIFYIKFNNKKTSAHVDIEILSSIGQRIYKEDNLISNQYIKLKDIPAGIYILKTRFGDKTHIQRFSVY